MDVLLVNLETNPGLSLKKNKPRSTGAPCHHDDRTNCDNCSLGNSYLDELIANMY